MPAALVAGVGWAVRDDECSRRLIVGIGFQAKSLQETSAAPPWFGNLSRGALKA
jgi:hypothetical protein